MRKKILILGLTITLLIVVLGVTLLPKGLSDKEKLFGLSEIWHTSSIMYAFWELYEGEEWDEVYKSYIPQVLETSNDYEYYQVLERFLATLGDGHSRVVYPEQVINKYVGSLPIVMEYIEGRYIVTNSYNTQNTIPKWSEVLSINGIDTISYLEQYIMPHSGIDTPLAKEYQAGLRFCSQGKVGQTVRVEYKTQEGEVKTKRLKYGKNEGNLGLNFNLPSSKLKIFEAPNYAMTAYRLEGDIIYIYIPSFKFDYSEEYMKGQLDKFFDSVKDAKAFIVDVRYNTGGNSANGLMLLNRFVNGSFKSFQTFQQYKQASPMAMGSSTFSNLYDEEYTKKLEEIYPEIEIGRLMLENRYYIESDPEEMVTLENSNPLEQPLVILTGHMAASAAEDFAAYVKSSGRGTLIGTHTKGGTGNVGMIPLPGDGMLWLTAQRTLDAEGNDILNRGILPDIYCEQTLEDLINGRDTILERAMEYLNK